MKNENWILCRKPLQEKTIADNVLKYGTGGINIDESRIETDDDLNIRYKYSFLENKGSFVNSNELNSNRFQKDRVIRDNSHEGRFPANFIYASDDEVIEEFNKAGYSRTIKNEKYNFNNIDSNSDIFSGRGRYTPRQDEGTPSRFFFDTKE